MRIIFHEVKVIILSVAVIISLFLLDIIHRMSLILSSNGPDFCLNSAVVLGCTYTNTYYILLPIGPDKHWTTILVSFINPFLSSPTAPRNPYSPSLSFSIPLLRWVELLDGITCLFCPFSILCPLMVQGFLEYFGLLLFSYDFVFCLW